MKTLIEVDLNILDEYNDWKETNPNWCIDDYLHLKYDMNGAIALSKLYFPSFIEKNNCVILEGRYDEDIFLQWYTKYDGDIKKTEFMCNFYEIKDFFKFEVNNYESLEIYNQAIDEFAKILKKSWEINLKLLFPNREMIVDVFDEYNSTRITIFTESTSI
jgi:hypothetical protein